MDPDPGGYFNKSAIFKTSFLTIVFSSIHFYRPEKAFFQCVQTMPAPEKAVIKKTETNTARKKKTIYLTFDDGPNKGTRNVMHIIKKEKVPVTLFVIGEHVYGSKYQSVIYDSVCNEELFEIANHSYTHAWGNKFEKFYDDPDSSVKDFKRCADSLNLATNIVRTPGRNIWRTDSIRCTDIKSAAAAADSLQNNGFTILGWDLEWHFNDQQRLVQTMEEMMNQVDSVFIKNKTKTNNHLVLLAHDQVFANSQDSATLQNFIMQLKNKEEYNFEQVSRYPGATSQ